jgi:predicted AAA+ superfamily ATPase
MYRKIIKDLKLWKSKRNRKPLILYGARQVGKTWIIKEFGNAEYAQVAYVMMADNPRMRNLFEDNSQATGIISGLEAEVGFSIKSDDTLIVLDEIQEIPEALSALKHLYEQTPDYHIIAAGSLLGVTINSNISFPVGKVNSLYMYPLDFEEFVLAVKSKKYSELLHANSSARAPFHNELIGLLRSYLVVGGMPEVVQGFTDNGSYIEARNVQKQIIADFEHDFGKHAPTNMIPRIQMVFNSMPSQLAKENKKFIYGTLRAGARAKDYELAIQWLLGAGILQKIPRVNALNYPLKHYEDVSAFKLFMVDVGLLGAMSDVEPRIILEKDNIFVEYKGAMTEQFVTQQLVAAQHKPYYYSSEDAKRELDLVIEKNGVVIPIEVKSAQNLASKSLKFMADTYGFTKAVKFSTLPEKTNEVIRNLPLYLANTAEY